LSQGAIREPARRRQRTKGVRRNTKNLPQDFAEDAQQRRASGQPAAVRFAVPESGETVFEDAVFGRVEFANTELEDSCCCALTAARLTT